ncbi:taste receptor type 2 member 40-like [Lithobates pipiens]
MDLTAIVLSIGWMSGLWLTFSGVLGNFFFIITNVRNALKGQIRNTADKTTLSLSFSNVCCGVALIIRFLKNIFPSYWDDLVELIAAELAEYGLNSSARLSSWLSFFYFIHIVQSRWRSLSSLKEKMDVLIPWVVLLVELVPLSYGFINFMADVFTQISPPGSNLTSFHTTEMYPQNSKLEILKYVKSFGSLMTAILFIAGILVSLKLHLHNMSKTLGSSANGEPQRVVRTMTYLLVFYILLFVISFLNKWPPMRSEFIRIFYFLVKCSCSPFQFLLLILGNSRYKKMLRNSVCFYYRMWVQED